MRIIVCLLLCVSFGAIAAESYALDEGVRSAADAYAHAAHLQALHSGGSDQLRVWTQDYLGRRVTGYIAGKRRATKCFTKYHYSDGIVTISDARCQRVFRWDNKRDAIELLDNLSRSDGKQWSCPMLDGGGVIIDGVYDGKRITLSVGNPGACNDPVSKSVMKLLMILP